MALQAEVRFTLEGQADWAWLAERVALPPECPLPLPQGRVDWVLAATLSTDAGARLELIVDYRAPKLLKLLGGRVELSDALRLTLRATFAGDAELLAAREAWDAPGSGARLAGEVTIASALRIQGLPPSLPLDLQLGNAEGWIAVQARMAAGSSGATLALAIDQPGRIALQLPGLPLAQAPLTAAVERIAGELSFSNAGTGHTIVGQLEWLGRADFRPRFEPGEVALLGLLAPVLEGVTLGGQLSATLVLGSEPTLTLRCNFDDASVGVDVLALLRDIGSAATGQSPPAAMQADLRAHSTLGFSFQGLALRLNAEDPAFAIDIGARFGGIELPAHIEATRQVVRLGLGTSSLATRAAPLELPLRIPAVSAADLGYAPSVAEVRLDTAHPPPDQWIRDRLVGDTDATTEAKRATYDEHVQRLVDAVVALTAAASGASGQVIARRHADHWALRPNLAVPPAKGDQPLVLGIAQVEVPDAARAGDWRANGDLALAARIDGQWQVLIAAPRLRFIDFHLELDLHNPRRSAVGGAMAFVFVDGNATEHVIAAEAELSPDAVYFSVQQLSAEPIRAGGIELHIARLLFGFGYTKRSLAFAAAGELVLPEVLVDRLDTSASLGVGVRVPQRTMLDLRFEIIPLYVGKAVVAIPLFQLDWDGRRRNSLAVRDTRQCEPYWDGAQLIVEGIARVGLKRLSFNPILTFFACANSDFDGELQLGNAETGLTVVADNLFWPYGQDSWTANLLFAVGIHAVPYGDNFCIGLRAGGFRLNFNLQRPVPTFSPLALFELLALATDFEGYEVAPRGPLADSVRISLTDAWLVLPPPVRRLFPAAAALEGKVFEATINLADYIRLLQGLLRTLRELVRAALRARHDAAQLAVQLRAAALALQDGGLDALLVDVLAALPPALRATRLDVAFGGAGWLEGTAVLVLAGRQGAGAELDARDEAGSSFAAPEFEGFTADDLAELDWPDAAGALRPAELTPALIRALMDGTGSIARAMRRGMDPALRAELQHARGKVLPAELQARAALHFNGVLAGASRGARLVGRQAAKGLGLRGQPALLGQRGADRPLSAAELLMLNRAVLGATVPEARPETAVVVSGARLALVGTQVLSWLGSVAGDGRFAFVSAASLPPLALPVAGLAAATEWPQLQVQGRLRLTGQAGPQGISARVDGQAHGSWEPWPGQVRLSLASAEAPARFMVTTGGRFELAGRGALALQGGALRVEGDFELTPERVRLRGTLDQRLATLARLQLEFEGEVGPGRHVELAGHGSVTLLGMALADVEATLDRRRLALAARFQLDQWRPHADGAATPLALDLRLAGAIDLTAPMPNLALAGRGSIELFGARMADAGAAVTLRNTRRGKLPRWRLQVALEGSMRWHGREWLGARIAIEHDEVTISGRGSLDAELGAAGVGALLASVSFDASVTMALPFALPKTLSVGGQWWLGLKRGDGVQAVRVPIAVGSLPELTLDDLPRVLVGVPGVVLPSLDAFKEWPLPVALSGDGQALSIPSTVTLPKLESIWNNLTGVLSATKYDSDDEQPTLTLGGLTDKVIKTFDSIGWPDDMDPPSPFEYFEGFALVLDWDVDARRLVLRTEKLGKAPRIEVAFDPEGVDIGAEFVAFINDTATVLDLGGWSVQDGADRKRRYVLPPVTLQPGERVTLWSGAGDDRPGHLHWGRRQAVWNNRGDTLTLRDVRGIERLRLVLQPKKRTVLSRAPR